MKIYIIITLLVIATISLGISMILEYFQRKNFNYSVRRSNGYFSYLSTLGSSFQKVCKYTTYRRILELLSFIFLILAILILSIF